MWSGLHGWCCPGGALWLVFSCRDTTGAEHCMAFHCWLTRTEGAEVLMQRLTWATRGPARGPKPAWYVCQEVDSIRCHMLQQPAPGRSDFFYHNHFVRCGGLPAPCRCSPCAVEPLQSPLCSLPNGAAAAYGILAQLARYHHSSGRFCRATRGRDVARVQKTAVHAARMCYLEGSGGVMQPE